MDSNSNSDLSSPSSLPSAKLTQVSVDNQNVALNLLVSFVNLAQRRGAFSLDEAAKIWECIQKFQINV
jgi:hypothetical protein